MNEEFKKICACLDESIKNSDNKLKLKTNSGTEINLLKQPNGNYKITFNTDLETYESITLDNLYKFLFENWRGNPDLGRDDSRMTLFEAIKKYIQNNCAYQEQKILQNKTVKNSGQTQPLNQILYGPPGTGKTYNTINKALEIIDGFAPQNRAEAKAKFEEYKKAGQIEFVTFHQSYGYEEFVEGIKANTLNGDINYNVDGGIFKTLSIKALISNILLTQDSMKMLSYDEIYDELIEKIKKKELKSLELKTKDLIHVSDITKNDNINFKHNGKTKKYLVSKERLKKLFYFFDTKEKFIAISNINDEFREVIGGCNSSAYWAVLNYIHQNNIEEEFEEIDIENMSIKEQYEIVKKYLQTQNKERSNRSEIKKYILIIDEINRGNISKIFGELITLIEPSKRIGADEEIKVKLPYSNDDFGVSSNLYIIGTMNTADRSIALMDTALRRRFDFTEMMPQPDLLSDFEVEGINIKAMLEKINKRVEYLYDRDHTIGHAYFMSLKENPSLGELENIFRNKIIPLLQEYFYDDWEKILMVLGDGFVQKSEIKSDIFDYKQDDYLEDEKFVYAIKENFDFGKFKK